MDFSFSDDQRQVADLANKIFAERASHERQLALERAGGLRFDRELWRELARAGLVGIALPEAHGGGGLGFLELALVLEEAGGARRRFRCSRRRCSARSRSQNSAAMRRSARSCRASQRASSC
jgi:alkylation response protein AidB-like acyl-CoA dehydrogenase